MLPKLSNIPEEEEHISQITTVTRTATNLKAANLNNKENLYVTNFNINEDTYKSQIKSMHKNAEPSSYPHYNRNFSSGKKTQLNLSNLGNNYEKKSELESMIMPCIQKFENYEDKENSNSRTSNIVYSEYHNSGGSCNNFSNYNSKESSNAFIKIISNCKDTSQNFNSISRPEYSTKFLKKKPVLEESVEADNTNSYDNNYLMVGNPINYCTSNVESIYTKCEMIRQDMFFSKENSIVENVNVEKFTRFSEMRNPTTFNKGAGSSRETHNDVNILNSTIETTSNKISNQSKNTYKVQVSKPDTSEYKLVSDNSNFLNAPKNNAENSFPS